jgi:formylglycine-generating enzyme required for sulfatase activity
VQVEGVYEQAAQAGLKAEWQALQKGLEQIQQQLVHKEKELNAARRGRLYVAAAPDTAKVEILNFDHPFRQGISLVPGKYHLIYIQATEVTQGQWKRVMGDNPSNFKDCLECPVEQVSWDDAQEFIQKLNQMEGASHYRLPTEAEWEYACRAATTTPFFTGGCISTGQANYNGNYPGENCPKGTYRKKTVKAGSFPPNAWGLHDMHGNVWEWCQDWYGTYPSGPVVDPKGPDKGKQRVLRGGSWSGGARLLRSAFRNRVTPGYRGDLIGFRVARDD